MRAVAAARDPLVGILVAWATAFSIAACGSGSERVAEREGASASDAGLPQAVEGARLRAPTRAGRFEVAIRPEAGKPRIGALHAWIVEVRMPGGEPAAVRQLVFDGGMPAHGHGFETAPRVTGALGPGVFRVDGVRFHMAGDWQIRVDAATEGVADTALFDVSIGP